MADITQNPDYRLVMTFLQNIRPGDMDQESADQLMMIGQRMQAGGALTEREREMFISVVGAMPQMPMDPGSAVRQQTLPSQDGVTYSPSSGVTYNPSSGANTMDMQQMIDAGIISPTRPMPRPSPTRPMPRPMR